MAIPLRVELYDPTGAPLATALPPGWPAALAINVDGPVLTVKSATLIADTLDEFPDHELVLEGADRLAPATLVPLTTVTVAGLGRGRIARGIILSPAQQVTTEGNTIHLTLPNLTEQARMSTTGPGWARAQALATTVQQLGAIRPGWSASYVTTPGAPPTNNAVPVTWTQATAGLQVQSTAIQNTGAPQWCAAVSALSSATVPCACSAQVQQVNASAIFGLTHAGAGVATPYDIDYGVWCASNGIVYSYELGATVALSSYSVGDVFTVALAGAPGSYTVTYYRNGGPLYAHAVTPTLPVFMKGAVYETNARIQTAILTSPAPPDQAWWEITSEDKTVLGTLVDLATMTDLHVRQGRDGTGAPASAFEFGPFGGTPRALFTNAYDVRALGTPDEPPDVFAVTGWDLAIDGASLTTILTPLGAGQGQAQVNLRRLWRVINDPSYQYYGMYGQVTGSVFPEYNPAYPIGTPTLPVGSQMAITVQKSGANLYTSANVSAADYWSPSVNGTGALSGLYLTATGAQVQAALASCAAVGAGNVVVEGPILTLDQTKNVYLVTWLGALALTPPTVTPFATSGTAVTVTPCWPRRATDDGRYIYDVWDAAHYTAWNELRSNGTDTSVAYPADTTEGNAMLTERALYSQAVTKLKRFSQPLRSLTVTTAGARPGPRAGEYVTVDIRDVRTDTRGPYTAGRVLGTFRAMRETLKVTPTAVETEWVFTDRDRYATDPFGATASAENARQLTAIRQVPQTTMAPFPVGPYEKEGDSQHPITLRVALPPTLRRVRVAPLHLAVLQPRSTVNTQVANDGAHSHTVYLNAGAITFSLPVPTHRHTAPIPDHGHSTSAPAHTHSLTTANHTHSLPDTSHSHAPVSGITTAGGGVYYDPAVKLNVSSGGSSTTNLLSWNGSSEGYARSNGATGYLPMTYAVMSVAAGTHTHGFAGVATLTDAKGYTGASGGANGALTSAPTNTNEGATTTPDSGHYRNTANLSMDDNGGANATGGTILYSNPTSFTTGGSGSAGIAGGSDGLHHHQLQVGVFEPADILGAALGLPTIGLWIDSGDGNFVDRTVQLGGPWQQAAIDIADCAAFVNTPGQVVNLQVRPYYQSGTNNPTAVCAVQFSGTWEVEMAGSVGVTYASGV